VKAQPGSPSDGKNSKQNTRRIFTVNTIRLGAIDAESNIYCALNLSK